MCAEGKNARNPNDSFVEPRQRKNEFMIIMCVWRGGCVQYTDDMYDVQWNGIIESVQIEELHDFSRLFIFILGEERAAGGGEGGS